MYSQVVNNFFIYLKLGKRREELRKMNTIFIQLEKIHLKITHFTSYLHHENKITFYAEIFP